MNNAVNIVNTLVQDVDADLQQHDTDINANLATHDETVKQDISTHDNDIKLLLSDVLSRLEVLQITANTNSAMLLEVVRLLHTPSGRRNTEVPACNGGPCSWNP